MVFAPWKTGGFFLILLRIRKILFYFVIFYIFLLCFVLFCTCMLSHIKQSKGWCLYEKINLSVVSFFLPQRRPLRTQAEPMPMGVIMTIKMSAVLALITIIMATGHICTRMAFAPTTAVRLLDLLPARPPAPLPILLPGPRLVLLPGLLPVLPLPQPLLQRR